MTPALRRRRAREMRTWVWCAVIVFLMFGAALFGVSV